MEKKPLKKNIAKKTCTQRQEQDPQQTQEEALPSQQPSQFLNQSQASPQQRDETPLQEFMNFEQFTDFGNKRQRTSLQTEITITNNLNTDLTIMPTPFSAQINQTQNQVPGAFDFKNDRFFQSVKVLKEEISKLPSLTQNDKEILLEFDKIFSLVTDDADIQGKDHFYQSIQYTKIINNQVRLSYLQEREEYNLIIKYDTSIQKIKDFDSIVEDINNDLSQNRIILIAFAKKWEKNCSNVRIRNILRRLQSIDVQIWNSRQFKIYDKYQEIFSKSIKSILFEISIEDQLSSEAFKGASSQVSRDQEGQLVQGNDMRFSNIERTTLEKMVQYFSSKDQEFKNMMENLHAQTGAKTDSEQMEDASSKQKKVMESPNQS